MERWTHTLRKAVDRITWLREDDQVTVTGYLNNSRVFSPSSIPLAGSTRIGGEDVMVMQEASVLGTIG